MGSACSTSTVDYGDTPNRDEDIHRPDHSQVSESARNFIAPVRTFAPKRGDKTKKNSENESLHSSRAEYSLDSPRTPQARNGRRNLTLMAAHDDMVTAPAPPTLSQPPMSSPRRNLLQAQQAAELVPTVVTNPLPPLHQAMGMWSEEELQAAVVEDDSTTLGGKDASMLSTAPTPGLLMMTPAGAAHDTLDASPSPMVAPFDTSIGTKNLHSSSRLRFAGSPNDSGVASRSKGGGFNSHTEYSSVQLLDALAMDLVSDRAGGSVASQMHRASASNQKRGRPKMASVLSVSSPEDDPALDYPELQDSGHQSRQLWIAAGGTAGAHLQHHGVPGGILSDGIYIPAAYRRQGEKDAPSLTMGPGRGDDHHHPDEYLGSGRPGDWSTGGGNDFEPLQQAPLDFMLS